MHTGRHDAVIRAALLSGTLGLKMCPYSAPSPSLCDAGRKGWMERGVKYKDNVMHIRRCQRGHI